MGYIFDTLKQGYARMRGAQPPAEAAPDAPQGDVVSDGAAQEPLHAGDAPRLTTQREWTSEPVTPVAPAAPAGEVDTASETLWEGIDDRLVALTEPQGLMAEEYRAIRTGMLARWQQQSHLVHTVTSATPQEGKTLTSLNLGLSFAELRTRRTIVIEADLRRPQFQSLLALPDSPGLVGLLEGSGDLEDAIHRVPTSRLHVIPAGVYANDRAVQLLSSTVMSDLVKHLRKQYDHVIIDTPPVVELADAGIIGGLSDDVVLIARMNRTPKPLIEQAIRILNSYNAPVAGIIATDHRQMRRGKRYRYGYTYGGYGHGYGYGYGQSRAA